MSGETIAKIIIAVFVVVVIGIAVAARLWLWDVLGPLSLLVK